MKRFLATITLIFMLTAATPVLAAENFDGPSAGAFGPPTSVEPDKIFGGLTTEADNINRSKDNAIAPPPFGSPGSYMAGTGNPLAPGLYGDISAAGANSGSGAVYVSADSGNVLPPGRFVFSGVISERSRGFANWR